MPTSLGFVQVRCAEEHRQTLVIDELQDDLPQFATRQRIDTDRRLIEQQEFRRADKGAGEAELLLHPARQPASQTLDKRTERRHFHQLWITLAPLVDPNPMQIRVEVEVFLDAEILVQPESLRHVANAVLDLLGVGGNVDAQDAQLTGIGGHQSSGQTHERGLPRSIGSDQRSERAAPDFEGNVVEGARSLACVAGKRLVNLLTDHGGREQSGRIHCWTLAMEAVPEAGGAPFGGRYTVAGEPR